ncbi:hypothetical protein Cob_v000124 [Colletotrichum orbiculare MAFF 240422]|uniref:Uncharacterized protein n=1 Tax=Colletotrichum orbiculare (strain 104-T / ATCC 96160 / CBS 514.97 / LARS 414 / MAFF 240422) TaxID=1213857 RepID=A0A484G9P3_COLOR|nr:hypothetical protein Cob_v000124 [Colletotrichum orbiculare MAFF 240422]
MVSVGAVKVTAEIRNIPPGSSGKGSQTRKRPDIPQNLDIRPYCIPCSERPEEGTHGTSLTRVPIPGLAAQASPMGCCRL